MGSSHFCESPQVLRLIASFTIAINGIRDVNAQHFATPALTPVSFLPASNWCRHVRVCHTSYYLQPIICILRIVVERQKQRDSCLFPLTQWRCLMCACSSFSDPFRYKKGKHQPKKAWTVGKTAPSLNMVTR